MRRKHYLLVLLIIVLALTPLFGCLKLQSKDTGPKRATITSVEIESPKSPNQEHKSVVDFIKTYLQTAFLDLKLVKKAGYRSKVKTFFDKTIQDKTSKDWQILSLGTDGKKLDSITKNKLQIKSISIYYDQLKNTSLSTVRFAFEAEYRADFQPVQLKVTGELSLQKQGQSWNIFSYKLNQDLHSKRKYGSKS